MDMFVPVAFFLLVIHTVGPVVSWQCPQTAHFLHFRQDTPPMVIQPEKIDFRRFV